MKKRKLLSNTFLSRFRKEKDGATAIEFAILALPFSALLFGIIELAITFFITSDVNNATAELTRQIRTGQFQAESTSGDEFRNRICDAMSGLPNCRQKLRVDVITSNDGRFRPNLLPPPPPPPTATVDNPNPIPPNVYNDSAGGDVVIVRAQFHHQLSLPTELTRLANAPGNKRVITVVTAFRNEPFS